MWNTQNIGPQIGSHWANTFIGAPIGDNGNRSMKTPPVDLLVWFAPRKNCRLQVVDRFISNPRTCDCPAQLRYPWEGMVEIGQRFHFTQVYYPHQSYRTRASSKNSNPSLKAMYVNDIQATAGASAITVLRDDVEASVLCFKFEPGQIVYVVFNPSKKLLKVNSIETQQEYVYIKAA